MHGAGCSATRSAMAGVPGSAVLIGFGDQLGTPNLGELLGDDWVDHDCLHRWVGLDVLLPSSLQAGRLPHIRGDH